MKQEKLDRERIRLAERIARVEEIPFPEAVRKVPNTEAQVKALVDRLNKNHGADRSPTGQKIARANARSRETGESFGTAARHTR